MTQSRSSVNDSGNGAHNGRGEKERKEKLERALVIEIRFRGQFKEFPNRGSWLKTIT